MTPGSVQVMTPAVFHVEVQDRAEFDRIELPVWDYRDFPIPMPVLIKELTDANGSTAVLFKYQLKPQDAPLSLACHTHQGPQQ